MIYTINGKALAVDEKDVGAPVLLVHGLGGTSNFRAPVVAASTRAESKKITCETLLISGTEDTTSPVASVDALRDAPPHGGAVIIPNCGHWTAVETPREVLAAIQTFYAIS